MLCSRAAASQQASWPGPLTSVCIQGSRSLIKEELSNQQNHQLRTVTEPDVCGLPVRFKCLYQTDKSKQTSVSASMRWASVQQNRPTEGRDTRREKRDGTRGERRGTGPGEREEGRDPRGAAAVTTLTHRFNYNWTPGRTDEHGCKRGPSGSGFGFGLVSARCSAEQHGRTRSSAHAQTQLPSQLQRCSRSSLHQRRRDDNDLPATRVFYRPLPSSDLPDGFGPAQASSNNTATHLVPQRVQFVDGL